MVRFISDSGMLYSYVPTSPHLGYPGFQDGHDCLLAQYYISLLFPVVLSHQGVQVDLVVLCLLLVQVLL